ncbi:hypothetical protein AVL55_17425 [Alteromonas macleodii]|uniref:Glycosyl transferase family 2 n=1 Tax=Alteromonas macleodii TaxID=28108 RepID=A0A126Q5K4_ALTMA|nr:glycosyltransferase family 2 protein [Alteromonas macleodii]AMJ99779.1 hypothetical protein AVL55_17425 [Alteromonas macleodii]
MQKVAVVAIAKDESPYLADWIHHYLFSGFDYLYIGINRTTDSTFSVLEKITEKHPNVIYEDVNWIDKSHIGQNPDLQAIAYSHLSYKVIQETGVDYILYVDIDEFWFSQDFSSIKKFLSNSAPFDIASFNWCCQGGEEIAFLPPFKDVLSSIHMNVKTLISRESFFRVEKMRCHIPMFNKEEYSQLIHLNSKAETFNSRLRPDGRNTEHGLNSPCLDGKYYILHRMVRSQEEYLSTVFRGNPEGESIKRNRSGFKVGGDSLKVAVPENYYASLELFITKCQLEKEIEHSRNQRLTAYQNIFDKMSGQQLIKEFPNAIRALKATDMLHVYLQKLLRIVDDIDVLERLASEAENNKYAKRVIERRLERLSPTSNLD